MSWSTTGFLEMKDRVLGGWSATLTLPDYGRVARDSGPIPEVLDIGACDSKIRDEADAGSLGTACRI